MNLEYVNQLLQTSTKLKQFVVTDRFPEQQNVFKATNKDDPTNQKIVKITSFKLGEEPGLPQLQTYVKLSRECNICRLLDYELVGYPSTPHVITVMENCGTDLFYFIIQDNRNKIDLSLILSIALELLNQIICLQSHNDVHGDIKIENVLIDDKDKATLVDFDKLPVIIQEEGAFRVSDLTSTEYNPQQDTLMKRTVRYYATNTDENEIIMQILSLPPALIGTQLHMDSNIPPGINDKRRDGNNSFILPTQVHVNIIDLYSWCYVILIFLYVFKRKIKVFNEFVYRALLAIIMNIILPNVDPEPVPIDVFDIPINADYIRKVGLGITVLLRFLSEPTVPNESCTNYKVRVFLDLIQRCESADELVARFNSSISDPDFENKQRKFDAESKLEEVAEGGARRRHTHRPKKSKKASKCKRTKRGTRRLRYKKKYISEMHLKHRPHIQSSAIQSTPTHTHTIP
jgi:serine/threonine protein kinase